MNSLILLYSFHGPLLSYMYLFERWKCFKSLQLKNKMDEIFGMATYK